LLCVDDLIAPDDEAPGPVADPRRRRIIARSQWPAMAPSGDVQGPADPLTGLLVNGGTAMSPVARWLRLTLLACVGAVVMSLYAPAEQRDAGWAPEAMRSGQDAESSRG
jgi:hypothetical protein